MIKDKIIVLGANGFLGVHLCNTIIKNNYEVIALVRNKKSKNLHKLYKKGITVDFIGDLFQKTAFKKKYSDIKFVVNAAALAHIDIENKKNINHINNLEKNIIKNFKNKSLNIIHISSAKIIESEQQSNVKDLKAYVTVKINGEKIISNYYKNYTILRPALVYGPEVKANFLSLIKAIFYNIPLPFKFLNNKRSYIYVENLTSAMLHIIKNKHFYGKSYYLCDINNLSTSKLAQIIAKHLEKRARLFYVPYNLIKIIFTLFRKADILNKVMEDFIIDNKEFIKDTNWKAPYSLDHGIKKTCIWYKRRFKL
ncbi:NAD-dependent epimerase/dehydratase family protein [Pelagibacteraceae bacterium]|nr:NAD-dependent epimerase/dehydratase family protein [Pelagibacteraceae bacterium]